jgi:hypothetical protein
MSELVDEDIEKVAGILVESVQSFNIDDNLPLTSCILPGDGEWSAVKAAGIGQDDMLYCGSVPLKTILFACSYESMEGVVHDSRDSPFRFARAAIKVPAVPTMYKTSPMILHPAWGHQW